MDYKIVYIGTRFKNGKGGIASVLKEYKKMMPGSYFIGTTSSKSKIKDTFWLVYSICQFIFLLSTNFKIEIIHIHGASYTSFYRKYIFFIIAKLYRKKVIYHIHGGAFHQFYYNSSSFSKGMIKYMVNKSDCLICLSEYWKEFFVRNFSPKRISIVFNIVPEVNPPVSRNPKSKDQIMNFLFLGNINKDKGIWLLLDSLKELYNEISKKAKIYIGGEGETKVLTGLIKSYNLENFVKYIGWVEGSTKDKYLRESDIFLLPSYIEGLPISILEAFSYCLPVISTNVGAIPEITTNGENGILINPGDKELLKCAILYSIEEREKIHSYGLKNAQKISEYYPVNVKKSLELIYNSI